MSKNEATMNTYTLPISGCVVTWREFSMKEYEALSHDSAIRSGDVFAYRKFLDTFIEKIENDKGELVADKKALKVFYTTLTPKDGLVLLTKIDLINNEVALVLKSAGLVEEKKALLAELQGMENEA